MSFRDDPKGWAKAQAERLRRDPKGWGREQARRVREFVDVAPFSDDAVARELDDLRARTDRLPELTPEERQKLQDDLVDLHERLSPGGALVKGAGIGFAAAVLPVIGMISGPLIGGAYGVYRARRLTEVRDEVHEMLRRLARGG